MWEILPTFNMAVFVFSREFFFLYLWPQIPLTPIAYAFKAGDVGILPLIYQPN